MMALQALLLKASALEPCSEKLNANPKTTLNS